ncbi:hypothetical protein BZG72_13135 [Salinivibrio sp. PR6]|uniref:hypothetical protein n=1 Tax=Salinivibrio sp. PR6 TaxID=1909485 RepID=UPI000988FBCD|nr:hypothetical protein [Salinivibrio sp. PR6]OOE79972.1 hypothetical protein BZG72_13135 [Salinivibrio sp. PR6]
MDNIQAYLPVISLIVAFLAVIVGPFISWKVAKLQSDNAIKLAKKQVVAPIRQAWIDRLRGLLSEILSVSLSYYVTGTYLHDLSLDSEDEHDKIEQLVESRLTILRSEVELLLNPFEDEHQNLLALIGSCFKGIYSYGNNDDRINFPSNHELLSAQSKKVLKLEWVRVKNEL